MIWPTFCGKNIFSSSVTKSSLTLQQISQMKLLVCSLFVVMYGLSSHSQGSRPLQNLHDYLQTNQPRSLDTTLADLNYLPGGNLNYLYPLYQLFREEKKFKKSFGDSYYDQVSVAAAFTSFDLRHEERGADHNQTRANPADVV